MKLRYLGTAAAEGWPAVFCRCPHCDRASTLLQVSEEGVATCGKCGNAYDLNNSGVPREGDSRPLYRYRTDLHGGRLMVHN